MSTELIPGKRYRVTIEGVADESRYLQDAEGKSLTYVHHFPLQGVVVELLPDPLPTTPGSVIRKDGETFLRRDSSRLTFPWTNADGDVYSDGDVQDATVLFDAGAAK